MQSSLKTADELDVGALIVYTNTLYVVSEQRLTIDGEHVASMLIKPYFSDGSLTRIEVLRNPSYKYRYVTNPVFSVEPCDDTDLEIMAIAVYTSAHREIIADYVCSSVRSDSSLPLEGGDVAHYGDLIALVDNGDTFEFRVIDKYRFAKHFRLVTFDTEN